MPVKVVINMLYQLNEVETIMNEYEGQSRAKWENPRILAFTVEKNFEGSLFRKSFEEGPVKYTVALMCNTKKQRGLGDLDELILEISEKEGDNVRLSGLESYKNF